MPTFLRRRSPPPSMRPLAWLQTMEQSRARLFPPENDTRTSCSNTIKSRESCAASQLQVVVVVVVLRPGGRDPGKLRQGQRIARRTPIF